MKFIITKSQLEAIISEQTAEFDPANIKVPSVSSPNEELAKATNIVNQSQDIKDLGEPPLTPDKVGNLYSCDQDVYESKVPAEHRSIFNQLKDAIKRTKSKRKLKEEYKKIKECRKKAKQKSLTEQAEIPVMIFGINTTVLVVGAIAAVLLLLILAKFVRAIITGERITFRVPCRYR